MLCTKLSTEGTSCGEYYEICQTPSGPSKIILLFKAFCFFFCFCFSVFVFQIIFGGGLVLKLEILHMIFFGFLCVRSNVQGLR